MLDTFQRYKVAYEKVREKSSSGESLKLLDIGSNGIGFGLYNHFKNVKQTNLDIQEFGEELINKYPWVDFVTYNGLVFPFEDRSFDIVLCSDTLEHIPMNRRKEFLKESFRVAKDLVIFTFPVSTSSVFEKIIYYGTFKKSAFLKEHIEYGLPTVKSFRHLADKFGFEIVDEAQNINRLFWIPVKLLSSVLTKLWRNKTRQEILEKFDRFVNTKRFILDIGKGYSVSFILIRK